MADYHANSVALPKFPMSAHDLSHVLKTCGRIGDMNCHFVEECIPSDIAHIKTDLFVRLDPLTFPIMHKIKVRQNFFFVPTRLILGDDLNEEFFSCKDMNAKLPKFVFDGNLLDSGVNFLGKNTLFDQMECQPVVTPDPTYGTYTVRNPVPFLSLQRIWCDYYADEILDAAEIAASEYDIDSYQAAGLDGVVQDPVHAMDFHRVSWSKDRFTSAQPDAQRVGEVYLMNPLVVEPTSGSMPTNSGNLVYGGSNTVLPGAVYDQSGTQLMRSSLTIDELWDEMVVQRFLNSMNEFGNERYVEILAGQFGVISADARLQRAQWIGGNEMVVNISEVLQTSESTAGNPLGSFAGKGIVAGRGRDIVFKVPEHGYIIGILTFVPENGYASGSARWLYKQRPLDFAFPRFNNLGESAVINGELFSDHKADADTKDFGEFGYQPQFDEYRTHPSRSTGDFRDSALLAWHLDRKFTSVPPLNYNFIHIDPTECNRIFNDTDPDAYHMKVLSYHKEMFVRPISRHPVPGKL